MGVSRSEVPGFGVFGCMLVVAASALLLAVGFHTSQSVHSDGAAEHSATQLSRSAGLDFGGRPLSGIYQPDRQTQNFIPAPIRSYSSDRSGTVSIEFQSQFAFPGVDFTVSLADPAGGGGERTLPTQSIIVFQVPNGSNYSFSATCSLCGAWGGPETGSEVQAEAGLWIISESAIVFGSYSASFSNTGVPHLSAYAAKSLSVALGGVSEYAVAGNAIAFAAIADDVDPNLTYSYSFAPVLGHLFLSGPEVAHPGEGCVASNGSVGWYPGDFWSQLKTNLPVCVTKPATLTFAEKGLPKSGSGVQKWCLSVGPATVCSTTPSVRFQNLAPGVSYSYKVVSPTVGQRVTPASMGSVLLTKSTTVHLTFAYYFGVMFTAAGLTSGNWSVTVNKVAETALWNHTIEFNLTNGTYAYKIGPETGYKSAGSPPKVTVNGAGTSVTVTFSKK